MKDGFNKTAETVLYEKILEVNHIMFYRRFLIQKRKHYMLFLLLLVCTDIKMESHSSLIPRKVLMQRLKLVLW